MRRVWPGAVVEESTVQVHISAIRSALGPDRAIMRIASGRGHRLLGRWSANQREASQRAVDLIPARAPAEPVQSHLPVAPAELIGRAVAGAACAGSYLRPSDRHTDRSRWDRKTRLALETAHILSPDLDGAVWVVELGSLSDAGLIAAAVASVLGLHFRGSDISPAALALAIGGRRLLLVIDNCEHVIDAAARVVETMVRLCPEVSVLATSREHMRIDGETTCKDGAHPAG